MTYSWIVQRRYASGIDKSDEWEDFVGLKRRWSMSEAYESARKWQKRYPRAFEFRIAQRSTQRKVYLAPL